MKGQKLPVDLMPLCVDLDGTLVKTDLLVESVLALLKRNPLYIFSLAVWLLRGKAYLKWQVARRVDLAVASLPYDERLTQWLRTEARCRQVVLCTATNERIANRVATHIGIFSEVIASDKQCNLSGRNKARELVKRFGEAQFDYAGNSFADLQVWRLARGTIIVNANRKLADRVSRQCDVVRIQPCESGGPRVWVKAIRVHQWLKNFLLFLPLLTAHLMFNPAAVSHAISGFVAFCVCASGVYLLNDMLDLDADRQHPRKRGRPFASGDVSLLAGLFAVPVLTFGAFAIALMLSTTFALVLLVYYVLTLAYSFSLKRIVMLDVMVLAALYTIRIIGGTAVINVELSFWLLAFSMFLFLSLAMLKRYAELRAMKQEGPRIVPARGYDIDDIALVQSLGSASGYVSVVVLALYINSTSSEIIYDRPHLLWLLCPLLLYWVSRAWLIAHRGAMHDDPIVFALTDRTSLIVLLCAVVVAIIAV